MFSIRKAMVAVCTASATLLACSGSTFADEIDFDRQVAPILKTYCAGCHNDTEREGDLSFSSLNTLRAGTPEGPVIVASSPKRAACSK